MTSPHRWWTLLGALAIAVAACSTQTTLVDVASEDSGLSQPIATQPPEPQPTPLVSSTSTPVPADQTPTVAPTVQQVRTPEPTVVPTPGVTVDDLDELGARIFARSTFADELQGDDLDCAVQRVNSNGALMARILEGSNDFDALSPQDQAALAIIAFDCAPETVATEFSASFDDNGLDVPDSVSECLIGRMSESAPDRAAVIEGFLYLADSEPVPVGAREPVVEALVECFPGSIFASALTESALGDPALSDAVDFGCLQTSIDDEAVRPLWQVLVIMPNADFDDMSQAATAPLLDAVLSCISFGQVMAAQAPAGVELSNETIACIDQEMAGVNIVELMESESGSAEIATVLLSCLTPEEFQAMGGG